MPGGRVIRQAKQGRDSSGDVGKARMAELGAFVKLGILGIIVENTRNRIGGVSGLGGAMLVEKLFGVTMVGSN